MPTYKYLNDTGLEYTLSKLKTYIDGQSGGGKGVIICDTSTMTIGDTIRVRDVYDSLNVQNKSVVTAGTPLYFEVNPYCYYKICTVQDIGGVATEIGGVYKTVDFGQTLFIDVLDKATFSGIKSILNAGQATSQIQVGDEVHTLVEGADWVMQVANVSASRVTLISKFLWKASMYASHAVYYSASALRDEVISFLTKIPQADQDCIATLTKPQHTTAYQNSSWSTFSDKIWLPNTWEVFGNSGSIGGYYGTPPIVLSQFSIFTTQANRVKTYNGAGQIWWTCDGNAQAYGGGQYQAVSDLGASVGKNKDTSNYILPCCAIEADS